MNILTKIEILISLGELKCFNTIEEALEWINLQERDISELNLLKEVEDCKKAYMLGHKLFLYVYGFKANNKLRLAESYYHCQGIEEFISFLERYNILKDLQILIKTQ